MTDSSIRKYETDQAQQIVDGILHPLGYAQDGTISAASALPSIASDAKAALINVTGANCRWRDDGTNPTTTVGIQLEIGDTFLYTGDLAAFKIIEETTTAVLNVSYYA